MAMRRIRKQPLSALGGWFAALKEEGIGAGFLVLTVEGAPSDSFVQIISDRDGFLIDHPLYTKRQQARQEQVLLAFREERVGRRFRENPRTLIGLLPRKAETAAAKVGRLITKIFGLGPDTRLEIGLEEFCIVHEDQDDDQQQAVEPEPSSELPSVQEFAIVTGRNTSSLMREAGYEADFTLASLKEVDRLIEEHSDPGEANLNGFLAPRHLPKSNRTAVRLLGLGCYVGEVLRQTYGGEWRADSEDLHEAVHSLRLWISPESESNPIGKVFKRFENGPEDSLEAFGLLVAIMAGGKRVKGAPKTKSRARRGKKNPSGVPPE